MPYRTGTAPRRVRWPSQTRADHQGEADAGVEQVPEEEVVRVALVELGAVAGRRVDEQRADQDSAMAENSIGQSSRRASESRANSRASRPRSGPYPETEKLLPVMAHALRLPLPARAASGVPPVAGRRACDVAAGCARRPAPRRVWSSCCSFTVLGDLRGRRWSRRAGSSAGPSAGWAAAPSSGRLAVRRRRRTARCRCLRTAGPEAPEPVPPWEIVMTIE